jgi:hypothetical protein
MRKILIGLGTLILVVLIFILYAQVSHTPQIKRPENPNQSKIDLPDFGQGPTEINEVRPGEIEMAEFTVVDPVSNKLRRILGFEKLLNPNQAIGAPWEVRKPYIKIFEDGFHCQIFSRKGRIQVERVEQSVNPREAELYEDVEIHIQSTDPEDPVACSVYMDQVAYSSERSMFSTDGEFELISAEAHLEGEGLDLIYNAGKGRIELMKIRHMKFLRIRNVVGSGLVAKENASTAPELQAEETDAAHTDARSSDDKHDSEAVAVKDASDDSQMQSEHQDAVSTAEKDSFYMCQLLDDVVIRYGNQVVVNGDQEVNIYNILWNARPTRPDQKKDRASAAAPEGSETDTPKTPHSARATDAEPRTVSDGQAVSESGIDLRSIAKLRLLPEQFEDHDELDVRVTCGGNVIMQPMLWMPLGRPGPRWSLRVKSKLSVNMFWFVRCRKTREIKDLTRPIAENLFIILMMKS